jgi:hypothetical protein
MQPHMTHDWLLQLSCDPPLGASQYASRRDVIRGGGLMSRHDRPSHRVFMTFFDPMLSLRMINSKEVPTKAVIAGLIKKLDSDPRYLEKLTAEIKPT